MADVKKVYEEHNHETARQREDKHQCQCADCKAYRGRGNGKKQQDPGE